MKSATSLASLLLLVAVPAISLAQIGSETYQVDDVGVGGVTGYGTSENFSLNQESGGLYQIDEAEAEESQSSGNTSTRVGVRQSSTAQTTVPLDLEPVLENVSASSPETNDQSDIIALQTFLNQVEGTALAVDGIYDADDVEAIKAYQRKYSRAILDIWGLSEPTGYVGITTRLHMNARINGRTAQCPVFVEYNAMTQPSSFSVITNSPEVAKLQDLLRDLDLYTGEATGSFDAATDAALREFQLTFKDVMLDPWGIISPTGIKYKTTNKFLNYLSGCDTPAVFLEGVGIYEGIGLE